MKFEIRQYQLEDKPKVIQLMNSLQDFFVEIDTHQELISFDSIQAAEKYIDQAIKDATDMNGVIFITESEQGEIVGFIQGIINSHEDEVMHNLTHQQGKDGWIGLLIVDEQHRNQGVGKQLLKRISDFFDEAGCSSVRLKVSSNNTHAIEVYKSLGFAERDIELAKRI
jgi:ribosomal protein S18 acetylase RimI-like enzyme